MWSIHYPTISVPGRPTIWMIVGQGPIVLAVGAGGGCLDIFTLIYPFFPLSPSLWETARYRLKYCLKGPLNPKSTNQPTPLFLDMIQTTLKPPPYLVISFPGNSVITLCRNYTICFCGELKKNQYSFINFHLGK